MLPMFKISHLEMFNISNFNKCEIQISAYIFSKCVGRTCPTCSQLAILDLPKLRFLKMSWDCSWTIWNVLVSPKINNIGFGSHGHVHQVQEPYNEGFSSFPKMSPKSY